MNTDTANAVTLIDELTEALNSLSAAERVWLLDRLKGDLSFCLHCGYNDCRGHCENDE